MSTRKRLPNRRQSESRSYQTPAGLRFTVTSSRYTDGGLAEVFIENHKVSSDAGIMASEAAIAASLALQYGCPAEVIRKAMPRDPHGRATGPLGTALDLLLGGSK